MYYIFFHFVVEEFYDVFVPALKYLYLSVMSFLTLVLCLMSKNTFESFFIHLFISAKWYSFFFNLHNFLWVISFFLNFCVQCYLLCNIHWPCLLSRFLYIDYLMLFSWMSHGLFHLLSSLKFHLMFCTLEINSHFVQCICSLK